MIGPQGERGAVPSDMEDVEIGRWGLSLLEFLLKLGVVKSVEARRPGPADRRVHRSPREGGQGQRHQQDLCLFLHLPIGMG